MTRLIVYRRDVGRGLLLDGADEIVEVIIVLQIGEVRARGSAHAVGGRHAPAFLFGDAFGGVDLENLTDADIAALSQLLFSQFAADPELQACLLENIDVLLGAGEDPSILTREFCGTTLLDLFSGAGG